MHYNEPVLHLQGVGDCTLALISGPEFVPNNNGGVRCALGLSVNDIAKPVMIVLEIVATCPDEAIPTKLMSRLCEDKINLMSAFIQKGYADIVYIYGDDTKKDCDEPSCKFIHVSELRRNSHILTLCRMTNLFPEITFGDVTVDLKEHEVNCSELKLLHTYLPLVIGDFGPNQDEVVRCKYTGSSKYLVTGNIYNVTYSKSRHKCKVLKRNNPNMADNVGAAYSFDSFKREV